MKPPTIEKMTLRALRRHLQARRFAVPKLQRNFVWDARRAAKLLDSISRNMPIGSLFLWEMDRKSANLIRQSTGVLPAFNEKNQNIWFVIDGQQRLSVIHQAFEAQAKENDSGRDIDFGRLCFVVEPDRQADDPPRVVYRKPIDGEFVPVKDILAPDWKARMPVKTRRFTDRVAAFREGMLDYPVPVITVRSAKIEEIGEVFIRVNSQGMRITSADRAIALMGKVDVRAMALELRHMVRESRFKLSGIDPILMGLNLVTERPREDSDPPKLDVMARQWEKKIEAEAAAKDEFRRLWDRYRKAFTVAVDYLRARFPLYDETYLPSANMLATLSVFFFNHPGQPNSFQSGEIRKWFWATGVAQRYTGRGYHRNLMADARLFESLARGSKRRFMFREKLDPVLEIQGAEYGSRSALARAFFCLLAIQEPRYLETGDPIPLVDSVISHANGRDRHHIFPQAQLSKQVSPRAFNSLCNICFLVARDNQRIGKQLPRKYLAAFRDISTSRFRRAMKSHLIPVTGESGVWDPRLVRGYKSFRAERLRLICKAFEKAAGMKLFSRI